MLRLDLPVQSIYREVKVDEAVGLTSLNAGDLVYADIASTNINVGSRVSRPDNSPYSNLRACVWVTHDDRSFSSQGALHLQ